MPNTTNPDKKLASTSTQLQPSHNKLEEYDSDEDKPKKTSLRLVSLQQDDDSGNSSSSPINLFQSSSMKQVHSKTNDSELIAVDFEDHYVPYYETENPLKNRIGDITMSDISPRGQSISKKMERRQSLQNKIKKPGVIADVSTSANPTQQLMTNINAILEGSDSNECDSPLASTRSIKPPQLNIGIIPKLNLGNINTFKDDIGSTTSSSSDNCEDCMEQDTMSRVSENNQKTTETARTEGDSEMSSNPNADDTLASPNKKLSSKSASMIRTAISKRPLTSRESRRELQYIVANKLTEPQSPIDKNKQLAKLLIQTNTPPTPLTNSTTEDKKVRNSLQRHSVGREYHNLQEYIQSKLKEQKQLLPADRSPTTHQHHGELSTPRSSALQTKLLG